MLKRLVKSLCVLLLSLSVVAVLISVHSRSNKFHVRHLSHDHHSGIGSLARVYAGKSIGSMAVRSVIDNGNMTVAERSKFQRNQVDKFCAKYNLTSQLAVPGDPNHPVYPHSLINTRAQTMYCYVPKVGCTHLKTLHLIALGLLPASVADENSVGRVYDAVSPDDLYRLHHSISLGGSYKEVADLVVRLYYKFLMYRNPLERLVSAYKDKVQRLPLKGLEEGPELFKPILKRIYKYTHPQEYKKWAQNNGLTEVHISFSDFITHWLDEEVDPEFQRNDHVLPIFDICAPCNVRYDYYGDFETYDQDARVLVDMFGTKMSNLRHGYYSDGQRKTLSVTGDFYNELTVDQKLGVLEKLSQDLDFYYHVFPIHKNSHKVILNITNDL